MDPGEGDIARYRHQAWRLAAICGPLTMLALAGCGRDESRATPARSTGTAGATEESNYPTRLADELGCEPVHPLSDMIFPLRGVAARAGVGCRIGDATLHIFERDTPYPNYPEGGSLAEIDRSLGADVSDPSCQTWVLIGDHWFIVADDEGVLADVEAELGGSVRPIQPVSPVVSYPGAPGCSIGP